MKDKNFVLFLTFIMCSLLFIFIIPNVLLADNSETSKSVAGEYLVKFKAQKEPKITGENFFTDSKQLNELKENYISKIEKLYQKTPTRLNNQVLEGVYKITLKNEFTEKEFIKKIKNLEFIEYVEPNYLVYADLVPNDPKYSLQWALEKLEMPVVWKATRGSSQVVVAVVDSGVDYNHPDLANNVKLNTGEIPGNNLDDDHNGLIDDYYGFSFCSYSENKEISSNPDDDFGHGSHVAGIIGAIGNNAQGVAGLNWSVKIIPIKILDSQGVGTVADAAQGIYYAVNSGAKIINCSWGFFENSQTLKEAINYALNHDVLVVASVGNYNWEIKQYPAAYDGVIGVAALDKNDRKAGFSNFGSYVDIAAPGVEIYSTSKCGGYRYFSGTSQASPIVAGAAALLKAYRPELNAADLWQVLKNSAKDIFDPKGEGANLIGWDPYTGWGKVDILNALKSIGANIDYSSPTITIISLPDGTIFDELSSIRASIISDYPINDEKLTLILNDKNYRLPKSAYNHQTSELVINIYQVTGEILKTGKHNLKIIVEDIKGEKAEVELVLNVSGNFTLKEVINFPNPCRSEGTYFHYELSENADVSIRIFNSAGRLLQKLDHRAGSEGGQEGVNKVHWNLKDSSERVISNDVYFYLITARNSTGKTCTFKGKLAVLI